MLIFVHLPKTAGTTLAGIIERNYGSAAVLRLYESRSGEELARLPAATLARYRAVMGHFCFGAHRFLPDSAPYVTMLREPVDRVISHYYFVRGQPDHYLYETARRLDLREFVRQCGAEEPNNDQTRLLAGHSGPVGSQTDQIEMLMAAKQYLRDHFVVAGLSEAFDESLVLMKRAFGWRWLFYTRANVGNRRPPRSEIGADTLAVIRKSNHLDLQLYEHARTVLDSELRALGPALDGELRTFRRLNSAYGRIVGPLRSVRYANKNAS
jgi:hypothetical protein